MTETTVFNADTAKGTSYMPEGFALYEKQLETNKNHVPMLMSNDTSSVGFEHVKEVVSHLHASDFKPLPLLLFLAAALKKVLESIDLPENANKLAEAKQTAGNDMVKCMQFVFPLVVLIQMDVIKEFGFKDGRNGMVQFAQYIRALEREDPEVALLHSQVRSKFLPPVHEVKRYGVNNMGNVSDYNSNKETEQN